MELKASNGYHLDGVNYKLLSKILAKKLKTEDRNIFDYKAVSRCFFVVKKNSNFGSLVANKINDFMKKKKKRKRALYLTLIWTRHTITSIASS